MVKALGPSAASRACAEAIFRFHSAAMNFQSQSDGRTVPCTLTLLAALIITPAPARAALGGSSPAEGWAADFLAHRELRSLGRRLGFSEALTIQKDFVKRLQPELGRPVGYKVGLVTREAQEKYGVHAPLRGVLLEKMLLANGADVRRDFGVRPILEADLVVVVKDKAINKAASILDVAEHLRDVMAFIE